VLKELFNWSKYPRVLKSRLRLTAASIARSRRGSRLRQGRQRRQPIHTI